MDWASTKETAREFDCLVISFGNKKIRADINVLSNVPGECSEKEIEDARVLLSIFVKGVAACLKTKDVLESFSQKELNNANNVSLCRWKKLVDEIKNSSRPQIGIPTAKTSEANSGGARHVGKVRMTLGTSLPDPWLLTIKGAINYSAFRGTTLMPACASLEDSDDEPPNTTQGTEDDADDASVESDRASFLADALSRGGLQALERTQGLRH